MAEKLIQIRQSKRKKQGDHVYIVGLTGSGKSILAEYLLTPYSRVIILDGKHEFDAPKAWGENYAIVRFTGSKKQLEKIVEMYKKYGRVIIRPDNEYLEDKSLHDEFLNPLYDWCFEMGDMVVYDDEAAMSAPNGNCCRAKRKLMQQGRSKGISVWNVTQSPIEVPNIFMRQATHAFIFHLPSETDRTKLAGNYGKKINEMVDKEKGLKEYEFYYICIRDRGEITKMNPLPIN